MGKSIFYYKKLTFRFSYIIDLFVAFWLNKKAKKAQNQKMICFSGDHISTEININQIYEKRDLDILFEFLKKYNINLSEKVALDIGANIGNHSIYFSKKFKLVIGFEPVPTTFKVLELNTNRNKNIKVLNFGLSNKAGSYVMEVNDINIGNNKITKNQNSNNSIKSQFKTLDGISLPKDIGLIKIDVEGHENEVLTGGENLIKKNWPIILFELNKNDFVNGESIVYKTLKSFGYTFFFSIERSFKISTKFQLLNQISSFLFSRNITVKEINKLKCSNYSFIIAIPATYEENLNSPSKN